MDSSKPMVTQMTPVKLRGSQNKTDMDLGKGFIGRRSTIFIITYIHILALVFRN